MYEVSSSTNVDDWSAYALDWTTVTSGNTADDSKVQFSVATSSDNINWSGDAAVATAGSALPAALPAGRFLRIRAVLSRAKGVNGAAGVTPVLKDVALKVSQIRQRPQPLRGC